MQKEVYCQIVATEKGGFFSSKLTIEVDTGKAKGFWESLLGDPLKGEDGKVIAFNSIIDALNHMASKGWMFVNAYAISSDKQGQIYHYVLKKDTSQE